MPRRNAPRLRPADSEAVRSDVPAAEVLRERAAALLHARFGGGAGEPPVTGVAHGAVDLAAEHTHYSDGFAVLVPLGPGAAVAVRRVAEGPSRLALEGREAIYTLAPGETDAEAAEVRAVAAVVGAFGVPGYVEAAAVSTVPTVCFDARSAALGVAAARALGTPNNSEKELLEGVRAALAEGTGVPFGWAHVAAAASGAPPAWMLADTATREHLPVEAPPSGALACGLIVPRTSAGSGHGSSDGSRLGGGLAAFPAFHRERQAQAERALHLLREGGFSGLTAFRDLEHRDLERALEVLPATLQPLARHLVTENRRVPKLVRAARNGDWQLLGALMLMSHASLRADWHPAGFAQATAAEKAVDAVVEAAEEVAGEADGVYGARRAGRSRGVLVMARPAVLPVFFRRAARVVRDAAGLECDATAL